ncbi:MAG: alpha/beta hydrolase [Acidimicrobiia bacterium]
MNEIPLRIPLRDGCTAHGYWHPGSAGPIVVFAHGLLSSMDEPLIVHAAQLLASQGNATYRCNFYADAEDSRGFAATTPTRHGEDLDAVAHTLRANNPGRPVVVVAHSFGMVAATLMREPLDALVGWDASHHAHFGWLDELCRQRDGSLTFVDSPATEISPAFVAEAQALDCDALIRMVACPVFLLHSTTEPHRAQSSARYAAAAPDCRGDLAIAMSNHTFGCDGNVAELCSYTQRFLRDCFA